MKKLIVVLGPTGSGKSELAVKLAKKFNGEVVSADSRQIYNGLDIGTGKITKKEMQGVPHHLLDIVSPKRIFTVEQYRKLALSAINKIFKKGKLPILCGGSGFYIQAVIDGIVIPKVKPDWRLRSNLNQLSVKELFKKLKKLDPRRAKEIDKNNPRRLIRAIEIVVKTKKPVPDLKKNPLPYPILMIGVKTNSKELKEKINKRVERMIRQGLEKEVKQFPMPTGRQALPIIGYQEWSSPNSKELIIRHTLQYAKRQMTWFSAHGGSASGGKNDRKIHWIKNYKEGKKLVKDFLLTSSPCQRSGS